MSMAKPHPLGFSVIRCDPELISPAEQTPKEIKNLSRLDYQFQHQVTNVFLYRNKLGMEARDPVQVIKEAISKALVYYYPFAGRLRVVSEGNETLFLECTGEGISFIEANAESRLDSLGGAAGVLHPPFQGDEDIIYNAPGCSGVYDSPLLFIQVTRFRCGGFTFALTVNHTICDAAGIIQFTTAVAEVARGVVVPSVKPVWKRELLTPRRPLQVSCKHHVYDELDATTDPMHGAILVDGSVFFSSQDIEMLKRNLKCSMFDAVSACLWKCRTMAMRLNFNQQVRLAIYLDARAKFNPPMPVGYYGNVVGVGVALSTVEKLCLNSLDYAVDLVKNAKAAVTEEFMRSTIDFVADKRCPRFTFVHTYFVSCVTQINFHGIDFDWGKPIYGGPVPGIRPRSFILPWKNSKGEDGIVVTMRLPSSIMGNFAVEISKLLSQEKEKSLEQTNLKPRHQSLL